MAEEKSFWGLVIEPGKQYKHHVERTFHISMVAIDQHAVKHKDCSATLILQMDNQEFVLCNVSSRSLPQQPIDLNFTPKDEDLTFFLHGDVPVHLTGYMLDAEAILSDLESETGQDESIGLAKSKRKASANSEHSEVKKKIRKANDSVETNEEIEEDDFINDEAEEDSDFDSDDEMESDDDLDKLMLNESKSPQKMDQKKDNFNKSRQNKTPQANTSQTKKLQEKSQEKKETQQNSTVKKQSLKGVAAKMKSPESPKDTPSKKKLDKENDTTVSAKKVSFLSDDDQLKSVKKTLKGGVISQDLNIGTGSEAAPGKTIAIYYIGQLKSNGKEFDRLSEGKPFKFKLGSGDVIKGLEIGIEGMKTGGKRRITIPPKMAYGKEGVEDDIPPDSTLVFEVELKDCE